jgi:hypothetical protein
MPNKKCRKCQEDFTPVKPNQMYCKKCRPARNSKPAPKKAAPVGRVMPVKAHFCYNCGMPQPKEVVIG